MYYKTFVLIGVHYRFLSMARRLSENRRATAEKRVLARFSLNFRRLIAPTVG
jgi:hypothetical protein